MELFHWVIQMDHDEPIGQNRRLWLRNDLIINAFINYRMRAWSGYQFIFMSVKFVLSIK